MSDEGERDLDDFGEPIVSVFLHPETGEIATGLDPSRLPSTDGMSYVVAQTMAIISMALASDEETDPRGVLSEMRETLDTILTEELDALLPPLPIN
ncbi:MAG: hypothetical protein AAGF78_07300 [Pseudomonadota bacterium]